MKSRVFIVGYGEMEHLLADKHHLAIYDSQGIKGVRLELRRCLSLSVLGSKP